MVGFATGVMLLGTGDGTGAATFVTGGCEAGETSVGDSAMGFVGGGAGATSGVWGAVRVAAASAVGFSADGKWLAAAGNKVRKAGTSEQIPMSGLVKVWEISTGKEVFHVTFFQARPEQPLLRLLTTADSHARTLLRRVIRGGLGKKDLYSGNRNTH